MAILWDVHLHSSFSGDSSTPMEQMAEKALQTGMQGICMTEHLDLDYPVCEACPAGTFELDIDAYEKKLFALKERYAGRLMINYGIELGLQPHLRPVYEEIVAKHPFDFVIGSSHVSNGMDPYFVKIEEKEEISYYRSYFETIYENLNIHKDFDTYGHLDYVVRYGPTKDNFYRYETYADVLDEILKRLVSMNKAIECNTGAIRNGLKELNPSKAILKRYRELGGEMVTVGSDAHNPSNFADGFDRAQAYLKECGFSYYTVFFDRKPKFFKL